MLGILTPLEETRAYKDIANETLEKRLPREIELLRELRDEGSLTEEAYLRKVDLLEKELAEIRARLKKEE